MFRSIRRLLGNNSSSARPRPKKVVLRVEGLEGRLVATASSLLSSVDPSLIQKADPGPAINLYTASLVNPPTRVMVGQAVTFTASVSDSPAAVGLVIDGQWKPEIAYSPNPDGTVALPSYTFTSAGAHTVQVVEAYAMYDSSNKLIGYNGKLASPTYEVEADWPLVAPVPNPPRISPTLSIPPVAAPVPLAPALSLPMPREPVGQVTPLDPAALDAVLSVQDTSGL